jgi:hypothetical protein
MIVCAGAGVCPPGAPGEDVPFHTSLGALFSRVSGRAVCLFQKRTVRRTDLRNLIVILLALSLASCAAGPVYIAKTESEGIKDSYNDIQLRTMYEKNRPLLHEVYTRLTSSHINVYPEGLGFITVQDNAGGTHNYLMVNMRPQEIVFDMITSKADQRVSTVLREYLEKYLTYVKMSDIQLSGAEGLSLGVYWPVRDYLQCHENGGFIEYVIVSLSKDDLNNIFGGKTTLKNLLATREIIASLDLKEAVHLKPAYQ